MSEPVNLDTLSAGDKVVLAAKLLNEASAESEGIELDPGVLAAIEERLTHLEENPDSRLSWEEVKKSLMPSQTTPTKDRSDWTARKVESFEDTEKLHIQDWQKVSARERMTAAWEMVEEVWNLKKRDPNELRFQRIARCVKRGRR